MLRQPGLGPLGSLYQIDALEFLKGIESESVDLCVTDPAYESLEKHRATGTTTRLSQSKSSSNAWFDIFPDTRYPALFKELYRVLKPRTHAYIFCDETTSDVLKPIVRAQGFWVWKTLPWVKTTKHVPKELLKDLASFTPEQIVDKLTRTGMGYHWRASNERILFLEKRSTRQSWPRLKPTGKGRRLNDLSKKDVLYGAPVGDAYPTEKPVSVIEQLIENSSDPGDTVIDMFAGSGATGEAAANLERRFILGDTSDRSMEHILNRLREHFYEF